MNFRIKKMSPVLLVADMNKAIEFYTRILGFDLEFRYEDFYAGLIKNDQSIHIKMGKLPVLKERQAKRNREDIDLIFSVDSVDVLYAGLSGKAVHITQPLRKMPYGKEFYIADPDNNIIAFMG